MNTRPSYHALVDSWNYSLLALSTNGALIADAARYIPDSICIPHVDRPHYTKRSLFKREPFFLMRTPTEKYPEWRWDISKRIFSPLHTDLITKEIRTRSKEAVVKIGAIDAVTKHINIAREELLGGTHGEESLHRMRKEQAEVFIKTPTLSVIEAPLVFDWAQLHKTTPLQAARDMQLMEKIYEQKLMRSEATYQKFTNAIRTSSVDTIPHIVEEFILEHYINAFV